MRIVMLNGQNHKGSSYNIGKLIANKIEGDNEVTEFFFPRDLNYFCLGCYSCIENVSDCPYYDDKKVILDAIDKADIIIVTTPTYCMHMSAPLKSFFDLTFDAWIVHRPMESMFSKRAIIVSSSAGSSPKSAMSDVKDCLFNMGIPYIKMYGLPVQAMNWQSISDKKRQQIEQKTDKIAKKFSKTAKPHVGIKTKAWFKMMSMMHAKGWDSSQVESEYWKEKGWLDGKRPWKN